MPWERCIQQSYSSESPMQLLFSRWFPLKGLCHTGRELQGCTRLYHLHLHRSGFSCTCTSFSTNSAFCSNREIFYMQVAIEFPYVFVQTVIYGSVFYSMGSFEWDLEKFVWYIFFMYFTLLYFTFFGMMTTAVTPNHNVAPIIAAPFYMLWNLFCGFMITHKVINCKLLLSCLSTDQCVYSSLDLHLVESSLTNLSYQ